MRGQRETLFSFFLAALSALIVHILLVGIDKVDKGMDKETDKEIAETVEEEDRKVEADSQEIHTAMDMGMEYMSVLALLELFE